MYLWPPMDINSSFNTPNHFFPSFDLFQVVLALWLGLDVRLCRLLHLSPLLLHPSLPLIIPPSPQQAGGGRRTLAWFLQTAGPPGEHYRKLLWNVTRCSWGHQWAASACTERGGGQVRVPESRDGLERLWGFRGCVSPLSVLPAAGGGNSRVRPLSKPWGDLRCPTEDALFVLRSPSWTLDLSAALSLSLLSPVPHSAAGRCSRLSQLEGTVSGLVSHGAKLVLPGQAWSGTAKHKDQQHRGTRYT